MNIKEMKQNIKKSWDWIWNSDSIMSWIIALLLIYLFVKFIFFPGLGLIFGTSLPLAGVESSSMTHQIVEENNQLELCRKTFQEDKHINSNEYWETCGQWYENRNITKKQFSEFPLSSGFQKGDIIISWGYSDYEIGDIIIFDSQSKAPHPIIHRIISTNPLQTKGDHNANQLKPNNNPYNTDETSISEEQIIGKAVFKIPYLGWPKIWLTKFIKLFK